jgi:sarcosine oxidase
VRVVVVGAGVMGAATAWAIADTRGVEVTVRERFARDRVRGSSHGRSRIVRLAYPDERYVRLAREAYAGWRALERESDTSLLDLHGLVELAETSAETSAPALGASEIEHRFLDGAELRRLGALLPDGWVALLQPEAGIVRADLARDALLAAAEARGAHVEYDSPVESVDDVDADVVVVTAGPWVRELVPELPVRVTRETLVYFRADSTLPALVELAPGGGHALYALHDPVHGVKAGVHHGGVEIAPTVDGSPDDRLVARAAAWVRERLPDVDPEPVDADTCFYTTTADHSFLLERRGRVVVGSACSGHGFKFAPVVGRRLAALALG